MANYKSEKRPLTAAERTAKILRNNRSNPFCTPISGKADADKTQRILKAAI